MIRVFNRLLVCLIGAVLLGGGALVIIEAVSTWTHSGFLWIPGDQWLHTFQTTAWSAPIVLAVSGAVGSAGLLLVSSELKPQRKRVVEYATDSRVTWLLLRRSTEARLGRRLSKHVPLSSVRARFKPRRRSWVVTVRAKAAASARPELEQAAREELQALHAPSGSRVKVHTTGVA